MMLSLLRRPLPSPPSPSFLLDCSPLKSAAEPLSLLLNDQVMIQRLIFATQIAWGTDGSLFFLIARQWKLQRFGLSGWESSGEGWVFFPFFFFCPRHFANSHFFLSALPFSYGRWESKRWQLSGFTQSFKAWVSRLGETWDIIRQQLEAYFTSAPVHLLME